MATPKSNAQMWKEFGAWLRAEDVSAFMGKATGGKEAVAKTSTKRTNDLRANFDPSYRPTRVNPGAKPATSVGGGRGTNPGNPGSPKRPIRDAEGPKMVAKPPVRTSPTVRPGRLAPENGITITKVGKNQTALDPVKVGRQRPPSISGEGRRYAPRKTNDAIPNSLKRNRK